MSDPTCPITPGDHVIAHEQEHVTAHLPHFATDLLGLDSPHATFGRAPRAGTVYPCAVAGISLTDYSKDPSQKGWGAHCTGPFTTITASNGVKVTVDSRIAELTTLLLNETIRRGYVIRQADTGAYNCRYIAGTTIWSNHAWGLAIDIDWNTNPQHSPLTTDEPSWMLQLWNRYGYAWGGNYNPPTVPDAMHHEFMGTPAQAVAATNLARSELTGGGGTHTGTNLAPSATVTASSEYSANYAAAKAVDGVTGVSDSGEWASAGEKAGAWLQLTWSGTVTLNEVVLYDRPNPADQVTGGTLTFSDGSTVAVPTLANAGTAVSIALSNKVTTSLKFTATSVSSTTVNIGLSEIQTWGVTGGSVGTGGQLPAKETSPITGTSEVPGFDCSYSKPGWVEMQSAGYTFMIGYVSPTPGKNLSAANFYDYRTRAGMGVGLVFESTGGRSLTGGSAGGAADGASADQQADAIGYSPNAPIFFAVDVDTTSADYPAIQAYGDAFNANTKRPVGIYGEFDVIEHFVTPGVQPIRYGWQTAAWSNKLVSSKANLYQRVNHPGWPVPTNVSASDFDEDVAIIWLPLDGWQ